MLELLSWQRPEDDFIKLDIEGSSLGNPGRAGSEGLIHHREGLFVVGFTGFAGFGCKLLPELMALKKHGLLLAWERGYRRILCDSDSMDAIWLVTAGIDYEFHKFGALIVDIRDLLKRDWLVKLHRTYL
jgi:hypothetical protein